MTDLLVAKQRPPSKPLVNKKQVKSKFAAFRAQMLKAKDQENQPSPRPVQTPVKMNADDDEFYDMASIR